MSNQITPNPSVPTQVVQELKFPKMINNLGIIPTSYKDSMSYYECLAWLCKYLEETVIPTLNQNGEAVEELQSLYIELNEYVTNYFDNLDVQEEINNKLDEMVEDGTLESILLNYVSVFKIFDSFEEITEEELVNNEKIKTLGYNSLNDGGSAEYYITDSEPSELYYEKIGNLYAVLISNKIITSLQLGGLNTDISEKIQKLVNLNYKIIINCDTIINGIIATDKKVDIECINNSQITITDNFITVVENPESYADITSIDTTNNTITTSLSLNVGDVIKIANDNLIKDKTTGKAYYGEFFIISNKNNNVYSLDRLSHFDIGNMSNLKAYKYSDNNVNLNINIKGNIENTTNAIDIKGGKYHNLKIKIDKWKHILLKLKSCYGYNAEVYSNYQPSDPEDNNALGYCVDDSASSNFKVYVESGANRHPYSCAGQIVSDETWLHGLCMNGEISAQVSGYSACLCDDHPFAYNLTFNNVLNNKWKNNGIITTTTYNSAITQRSEYNVYNNIKAYTNNIYQSSDNDVVGCIIKNSEFYDIDNNSNVTIINDYGTTYFDNCYIDITKKLNIDSDSTVIFNNCTIKCLSLYCNLLTASAIFNNCNIEISDTGSTGANGEIIMNNCTVTHKGSGSCRIFSGSGATIRINNLCFINPQNSSRNMIPVAISSSQPVYLQNIALIGLYSNSSSNPMNYIFGSADAVGYYQNFTGILDQNFNA